MERILYIEWPQDGTLDTRASKYYRANVSERWARNNDNGRLVSIGLCVGEDITPNQIHKLIREKKATECTYDEWNHSGCQSSCTLRGDEKCSW